MSSPSSPPRSSRASATSTARVPLDGAELLRENKCRLQRRPAAPGELAENPRDSLFALSLRISAATDVDRVGIGLEWGYPRRERTVFESYHWPDLNAGKGFFPVVHRTTTTSYLSISPSH